MAGVVFFAVISVGRAESVPLQAFSQNTPVKPLTIQVEGQEKQVWQAPEQGLNFKPVETQAPILPIAGTLYLEVTYLDKGYGRVRVTYTGSDGAMKKPDKYTGVVLADSGKWITSHQRLSGLPDTAVPEIKINLEKPRNGNTLLISKVSLQNEPFHDDHFQYLLAEAWRHSYDGPTVPGLDNTTLKGKVMVGYQGWFRTPNDPADRGWVHWGNMDQGTFSTDMWPDVSAYPPEALDKAGDVKTLSGKTGLLFSSAWPEVVRTHFAWMRQYQIDGAFVQRFLGDMSSSSGRPDWVLGNVRAAANQEGRIWAVEYDVSGAKDETVLATLKKDWMWMVDDFGIKKDPAYAREGGKLVVFIWGLPFPDRHFTPATANAVVDFFKNDPVYGGNYVIGGIPGNWSKMDPAWQDHFKKYDCCAPWMSTAYAENIAAFKALGVDYLPHVKPGFSWANLKHLPSIATEQYTPRDGGRYYQGLISKAAQAGIDRLFVGMFDEYDEGTAIMPMSDDPPSTPQQPGTVLKLFANPKMQEHAEILHKPQIDFTFNGKEPAPKIPVENYLMRWEGEIMPPADGSYTLEVEGVAGDSAALWIDGKQVLKIGTISGQPGQTASVTMTAGHPVAYRLDYTHTHASGLGTMRLLWQGPSLERQEIPASALMDAWGRFLTNEGHPSDWYLQLTAQAKEMITGKRAPTDWNSKLNP